MIGRATVILALCVSIGAHWAALQSVAWATMIVDYSHHVSLARAVAQTLDGEHPCDLCKHIVAAQHSQKKQDTVAATLKPDLICATGSIVLVPFIAILFRQVSDDGVRTGGFSASSSASFELV